MAENNFFDFIVCGSGPSGSSTSFFLSRQGFRVLLLDKAVFPRDKTCGDGISGKSLSILREMNADKLIEKREHSKIHGVLFSSPDHSELVIRIPKKNKAGIEYGYCCKRTVFDNALNELVSKKCVFKPRFLVEKIVTDKEKAVVTGKNLETGEKESFTAKAVIGADGANSIVAKSIGQEKANPKHLFVGIRAYYKNVKRLTDNIELHFTKEVLPGYFWIFPLDKGIANVGLCIKMDFIQKNRLNLQNILEEIITGSEYFSERFKHAKRITDLKGWNLPLGSIKKKVYSNRVLLVGDAASLIDPFTGEGIGNALYSGKLAAETLAKAVKSNDFSEKTLSEYEKVLWQKLGRELNSSAKLQWLASNESVVNHIIKKARANKELSKALSHMLVMGEPTTKVLNLNLLRFLI